MNKKFCLFSMTSKVFLRDYSPANWFNVPSPGDRSWQDSNQRIKEHQTYDISNQERLFVRTKKRLVQGYVS